jgi:ABC-2 type transport system permease protein
MADLAPASAGVSVPSASVQLKAITRLRWQILKNSLRTMRGRMEAVSSIFVGLWFSALGVGGASGIAMGAWWMVSHDHADLLPVLFWPICAFWIFFPLVATAFTEVFDSSNLLRYPLRYSSFFIVNIIYGSLDGSTIVGGLWLLGAAIGVSIASPMVTPWAVLALAIFGAANILLVRALFAWIERWLAQRKTREIMGIVFFLLIISFQLIGPISKRLRGHHLAVPAYLAQAIAVQKVLPPGLVASAIRGAIIANWPLAAGSMLLLGCYAVGFCLLLHVRLRGQYAGESFGEAVSREKMRAEKAETRSGWKLPGLSGQLTAIMEKEARYLSRSGPMLFALIMPIVVLFLFRMGGNPNRQSPLSHNPNLAFPVGAAYCVLLLTNLIYNNFGADGAGVQFFFVAPVHVRSVVFAKNLVHMGILVLEIGIVFLATYAMYGMPSLDVAAATLMAVAFAAPLDFCVGNVMSLYTPKKYDYGAFGRQRAPGLTVLASFGVQAVTIGIAMVAVIISRHYGGYWLATMIFAVLAAISAAFYRAVLSRIDGIAAIKQESLISIIAKTG